MKSLVLLFLGITFLSSQALAQSQEEFILFTPKKGRIKSKIVINKSAEAVTFTQPNYFEKVDGNPLIKIWIEKEIKKEIEESSPSQESANSEEAENSDS